MKDANGDAASRMRPSSDAVRSVTTQMMPPRRPDGFTPGRPNKSAATIDFAAMVGRVLVWLAATVAAAIVPKVIQAIPLPIPSEPSFVGGAVALGVALLVLLGGGRFLFFPDTGTLLGNTAWVLVYTALATAATIAVGASVVALGQRAYCGPAWPTLEHLFSRDVLLLFGLPIASLAFSIAPLAIHEGYSYQRFRERRQDDFEPVEFGLTWLIRLAPIGLAVLFVCLFWLEVEDFAARWPSVFVCPL